MCSLHRTVDSGMPILTEFSRLIVPRIEQVVLLENSKRITYSLTGPLSLPTLLC